NLSLTSVMGKISLKTRSSPTSSRSWAAASVCSSVWNARTCTSSRFGMSMTDFSFLKLTTGSLPFLIAKADLPPQATKTDLGPAAVAGERPPRGHATGAPGKQAQKPPAARWGGGDVDSSLYGVRPKLSIGAF